MSEWQPIATAPKDGTYILIYQPDEDCKVGVAEWGIGGWLLVDFDPGYDLTQRDVMATHWMPLPAAPRQPGCRARLASESHWASCGESNMGHGQPALCTDCGGPFQKA